MKEIPIVFKSKGQQVMGVLHLPEKKKTPLIILCHGWSANKLGGWNAIFVKAARAFSQQGFAVLRFDFRGSGDSEGKFEDQTITTMLEDLDAAISVISKDKRIDKSKIGLIGHSQGAYVSFLKATKDERIKSLVSWMGRLSDLNEFWGKMWFDEAERKGYLIVEDYKLTQKYVKDSLKYSLVRSAAKIKIPSLFIYGSFDGIVPPASGLKIYRRWKGKKSFKILPFLDHSISGEQNRKEVIDQTLTWMKENLK